MINQGMKREVVAINTNTTLNEQPVSSLKQVSEKEIKQIGFEFVKHYDHDQFKTNRYKKRRLEVEFTYKDEKPVALNLTMKEVNCLPITKSELQQLDVILNK